ncbi:substrate-binding domain-containing protein (plasmid) [Herbiconiux sp. KACC 21604]|uniref:sugar ABC transporter substrate-binding protein n=1 Tax=unclassified Herbiconiux TaxID=2618217 RepID=UPI001492CCB0|nr:MULTISPECIES: substrate-binding domain-containing protein [unclassified Herbiconiux]QJU56307.1 substrate-binding domain-containing protein [Herbiconiux sp. SALV-R1]WPO88813.1 substrate-binding domain-containing protein [Herbiconiux sp. KACC 21604]
MHSTRITGITAATVAIAFLLSACGASSAPTETGASSADLGAAQASLAEYAEPTSFPVSTPLDALPTGAKVAYAQCGTPNCVLFGDLMETPAKALGMQFDRVDAGLSADDVATAFDTILAGDYDAVVVSSIEPALWSRYLDELDAADVPVISTGNSGLDPSKVFLDAGNASLSIYGGLLADWATVESGGTGEIALYVTPELAPTLAMQKAFDERLAKLGSGATVRVVEIPVAQYGSTAPQIVVDDLTAHPDTDVAVFTLGEMVGGLPSALRAAGITDLTSIHAGATPASLQGIKDGDFTAGITADFGIFMWTLVDATARAVDGQSLDQPVVDDELVMQVVTADDLPNDNSKGWTGYPDFTERFGELWGVTL